MVCKRDRFGRGRPLLSGYNRTMRMGRGMGERAAALEQH
jgi:hypothetical protein